VKQDPLGYRSDTGATRGSGGLRLGVGAAEAIGKLTAAAALTVLLILSFVYRWNPFLIIVIGLAWAIVFAGLIVAPILSSRVADSLAQYGRNAPRGPREPTTGVPAGDSWDGSERRRPPGSTASGTPAATRGLMARPDVREIAPGFDWAGLVQAMADRLQGALGDGFTADPDGHALVLRHGEQMRRINLGHVFQPPPIDVGERALRGCLKMMDEAQMFSMRVRQGQWPRRGIAHERWANDLARPRVRLEEGEIRMAWVDGQGVVLRLPALRFGGAAPGSRDSNW
jgi:hypothetical protein